MRTDTLSFDIIILDSGSPLRYSGITYRHVGLGGSEFEAVLLAEELTKAGKKVCVINNTTSPSVEEGVAYYPATAMQFRNFKCKQLISLRLAQINYEKIEFEKLYLWATDLPNNQNIIHFANWAGPNRPGTMICVSHWQRSLYPADWNAKVIYNMIPDWTYDYKTPVKDKELYIYASAAMKGLPQTIDTWKQFKKGVYQLKKAELGVLSPGYDRPDMDALDKAKVNFLGSLSFEKTVEMIAKSGFMFYVNTMPETFSIVANVAEAVGTPVLGLCLNHPGALPETMVGPYLTNSADEFAKYVAETAKNYPTRFERKDYRCSKIMPQWLDLLR